MPASNHPVQRILGEETYGDFCTLARPRPCNACRGRLRFYLPSLTEWGDSNDLLGSLDCSSRRTSHPAALTQPASRPHQGRYRKQGQNPVILTHFEPGPAPGAKYRLLSELPEVGCYTAIFLSQNMPLSAIMTKVDIVCSVLVKIRGICAP
jgi:hypothetical protein